MSGDWLTAREAAPLLAATLGLREKSALRTTQNYLRRWAALQGVDLGPSFVPAVRRGATRGRYEVEAEGLARWCGVLREAA